MKKLLILLIISISFSVNAADSYRLDMDWVQDNLDNKDFMSDSNCSYSALLLTKFGDEFFQTTGLFIDDIKWNDVSSYIQFATFAPDNAKQKMYDSLDITIYSDAIVVKDLDLVFYTKSPSIVTKVEHKKKDVTNSFAFASGSSLGTLDNDMYFSFSWDMTIFDEDPHVCWFKLNKI